MRITTNKGKSKQINLSRSFQRLLYEEKEDYEYFKYQDKEIERKVIKIAIKGIGIDC